MAMEVPDTRRSVDVGSPAPASVTAQQQRPAAPAPPASGGFSQRRPVRRAQRAAAADPAPAGTDPAGAPACAEPAGTEPASAAPAGIEPATEPAAEPAADAEPAKAPRRRTTTPRKRATRAPAADATASPAPAPLVPQPSATPADAPAAPQPLPSTEVAAEPEPVPALLQAVVIRLGGTRYAVDMDAVAEVGRPPRVTRVPGLPAWVAGVANWRGRVLAILDIRSLLLAATGELPRSARVVVLARGGVTVGLLAERVDGVASIDLARVEPALPTLAASAAGLLPGQLTDGEGPMALLDPDAVLAMRDRLPRVRRAG